MARRTPRESRARPLMDDGSNRLLLAAARVAWDDAAVLCALSLALLVVFAPFVVLASAVGWLVVWAPMVLATAPVWFATVSAADRLLDHRGVSLRLLPRLIQRGAPTSWQIGIVPATTGCIVLGVLEWIARDPDAAGPRFALPPALGAAAAAAVLVGPAFAAAVRYDTGAGTAWQLAARIVVARPMQQVGLVVCFGILLWLTVALGPVVLVALGPFALLTVAVARIPDAELDRTSGNRLER